MWVNMAAGGMNRWGESGKVVRIVIGCRWGGHVAAGLAEQQTTNEVEKSTSHYKLN